MSKLDAFLPRASQNRIKRFKNRLRAIGYRGNARFCPVCGNSSSHFRAHGLIPREDALCVHCEAVERHRFVWLFMERKTDLFNGAKKCVLHVAPELAFEPRMKKRLGASYLTADLDGSRAMVAMDITTIKYPDETFDVIYCSHVLEHVEQDRKAMSEFYRTLKTNGWAILLVPLQGNKTIENPSVVTQEERVKAYGHPEHVRYYGADYVDRLREAGFTVDIFSVSDVVSPDEAVRMGLTKASGNVYFCTK